ncbi:MAG: rhodanese-like domain-containing protein [Magnetococcales bacterium]|nr:rhodanese-like domain-containing protein [Magnetococcales bacterium]
MMDNQPQENPEEIMEKVLFNEMISVKQLKQLMDAGLTQMTPLDLRTEVEQQEGLIPSSLCFPCEHNLANRQDTGAFSKDFLAKFDPSLFDPEVRYVLICRSGPRTAIALDHFLDGGLQACELIGGVVEWQRQAYPLETPEDLPQVATG